jgi:hypothetical protein
MMARIKREGSAMTRNQILAITFSAVAFVGMFMGAGYSLGRKAIVDECMESGGFDYGRASFSCELSRMF